MPHDLLNFRCWVRCGLVLVLACLVHQVRAESFSATGGSATVTVGASSWSFTLNASSPPAAHNHYVQIFAWTSAARTSGGSFDTNRFANWTPDGGGNHTRTGTITFASAPYGIGISIGRNTNPANVVVVTATYNMDNPNSPLCLPKTYNFPIVNTSTTQTKHFIIVADFDDSTPDQTMDQFDLLPGEVVNKTGGLGALCGSFKVYEIVGGPELPTAVPYDAPNLSGDPDPVPSPTPRPTTPPVPTPPRGGPTPSAVPTPPPDVTLPPTPTPSGTPTGQDLWNANTAAALKAIKDNTKYAADRLKAVDENGVYANERLKTMDENLAKMAKNDQERADKEKAIADAVPGAGEMLGRGHQAAAEAVSDAGGALPSAATVSAPSGDATFLSTTFSLGGGRTVVLNLNPFTADRFGPWAAWVKSFIAWILVMGFGAWASSNVRDAIQAMMTAPQARGNTVAGSGGQITALIAAAAITVIISTGLVALAAWRDTSLPGGSVSSMLTTNPLSGATGSVSKGLWLLDQVFPIQTAVAVIVARVTFQWSCALAVIIVATAVRFFVP